MNKKKITDAVLDVIWKCETASKVYEEDYIVQNHEILDGNLEAIGRSFSGSWIGYHANVYYEGFKPPESGDHFSSEWGLMAHWGYGSTGAWREYTFEQVKHAIFQNLDPRYEFRLSTISRQAQRAFEESHNTLTTLIEVILEGSKTATLQRIRNELSKIKGFFSDDEIVQGMRPRGQLISKDSKAAFQGILTPPHVASCS